MKLIIKWLVFSSLLVLLSNCASNVVVPKRKISSQPTNAWSRVLKTYVDEKGRVDFYGVSKDRKDLEEYVAYVTEYSPSSHPQKFANADDRMAYYLNAYNALAMYNVLHFEIPEDNDSFFSRFKFFYLTNYKIGGEYMSLYAFENDVIRPLGDPRIHVALNCMVRGCPRLPQTPFQGNRVQAQLESQSKEFYNETRNVRVDHKEKKVYLSEILDFFTDDFLAKSPSLIAYVNKYHNTKIPEEYEVEFIDYDWTVNIQPDKVPKTAKTDYGDTDSGGSY